MMMKKIKIHYFTSKIFKRYFYSYLSTVVILMGILSLLEMRHFSQRVKAEEVRTTQMRIDEVLEGLDVQTDYMLEIVARFANSKEFRKEYLKENKYHEIELLDSLDNYRNTSEIINDYFVIYPEDKYVFTSEGNRSLMSAYMSDKISEVDVLNFQDHVFDLFHDESQKMSLYSEGNTTIYMFPMNRYVYSGVHVDGVLCFLVYEKNIESYMERYGVLVEGKVLVKCGEVPLFSQDGNAGEIYLEGQSAKHDYTIQGWIDENQYFNWSNIFGANEVFILGLSAVLLFLSAAIIAYWNYLPFWKIVDRYRGFGGKAVIKDFKGIEMMLEELIEDKEHDKKVIQEQHRIVKEQLIGSIVKSGYTERLEKYLIILNIQLDGPFFGVLKCIFHDSVSADRYKEIRHEVEKLAGDNVIYGIYNDGDEYVFVSAQEENQIYHAVDVIQEFLGCQYISCKIDVVCCCKDLKEMHQAVVTYEREHEEISTKEDQKTLEKKSLLVVNALAYIETHATDSDLCLDRVAEELKVTTQYLSGVIKQQTGENYKKIVTNARMNEAKRLLVESDFNISIISWKCGYNDVSYFIKAFQKHTGVTPAKYREMNQ